MDTSKARAPKEEKFQADSQPFGAFNGSLLLVSLPFGILNFVLPIYGRQIGANAVEIGLFFSVFSLMTLLLRPLIGSAMDRYGRRWFFIGGLAVYGLAMLSFAFSTAVIGLVIARTLQGAASALLWLAASAIVADLAGSTQRGSAFGKISQASNQGAIIGTFIGFTFLFSAGLQKGWQQLFFLYALACGLAALIAWRRMPETRPVTIAKEEVSLADGLRTILRSRSLLVVMLVGMVTGASSSMIAPIFMIFLQAKFHAEMSTLAWAFLPSAVVWATLPTRLGKLSDRYGRMPLMLLGMLIAAVDSLLVPAFNSLFALAVLWAIEAVCFAASDPAGQALVTDLTREDQRGRVFGIYAFTSGLGAVIGPLAGGWLYETAGQVTPFMGNALVLAISAVIFWIFLRDLWRKEKSSAAHLS